jgi:hypothetical protein
VQAVVAIFRRHRWPDERVDGVPQVKLFAEVLNKRFVPLSPRLPREIQLPAFDAVHELPQVLDIFGGRREFCRTLEKDSSSFQGLCAGERYFEGFLYDVGRFEEPGFRLFFFR